MSAKLVRPVTSRVFKLCDYLNERGPERLEERIWKWPTWLMEVRIFEPILPHVFVYIYILTERLKVNRLTLWLRTMSTVQKSLGSDSDGVQCVKDAGE